MIVQEQRGQRFYRCDEKERQKEKEHILLYIVETLLTPIYTKMRPIFTSFDSKRGSIAPTMYQTCFFVKRLANHLFVQLLLSVLFFFACLLACPIRLIPPIQ